MFYVASVIPFIVFLELLWKPNLLICYKLNGFRPPRVNQFYIRALSVWRLRQVHTVRLNGIYGRQKTAFWKFTDVTISFTLSHCVMESYFSLLFILFE